MDLDREPCLSTRSHSVEMEDEITEAKGIDVDDAEGCDFNEDSDVTEQEDIGEFWGGMEDLDSEAGVGREEAGKDHEMWAGSDSVWNSEVEAVPIVQLRDSKVSINDSVSPIILALSAEIYLLCSQNNQPSESGGGNEGSLNNASDSEGMEETNHIDSEAVMVAATEIKIPEESGRSKRRRVPHKHADALNGCLCGQVPSNPPRRTPWSMAYCLEVLSYFGLVGAPPSTSFTSFFLGNQ